MAKKELFEMKDIKRCYTLNICNFQERLGGGRDACNYPKYCRFQKPKKSK